MTTELQPLSPSFTEVAIGVTAVLGFVLVLLASYRRNRCLFDRSVAESMGIALVSALFWPIWVIVSIVSWRLVAARWRDYRAAGRPRTLTAA